MNHHDKSNDSGDDMVTTMVQCQDCGHQVPEHNLILHQATACTARARAPSPHGSTSEPTTTAEDIESHAQRRDSKTSSASSSSSSHSHDSSYEPSLQPRQQRRRRRMPSRGMDAMPPQQYASSSRSGSPEVITIPDSPEKSQQEQSRTSSSEHGSVSTTNSSSAAAVASAAASAAAAAAPATPPEWSCPRCTLLNPASQHHCDACSYSRRNHTTNNNTIRNPDPTRRETLLPSSNDHYAAYPTHNNNNTPPSPQSAIGGGALLGSMLGAAGAYMNGRPVGSGAIEGAMSGAVGAALVSSVWNGAPGGGGGGGGMSPSQRAFAAPTTSTTQHPHPRASFRVVRRRNADGSLSETLYVHSPNAAGMPLEHQQQQPSNHHYAAALRQQYMDSFRTLQSLQQQGPFYSGTNIPNIDTMSYEQRLELFGDGSENRGASESDIRSLPVSTVQSQQQLPEDKRQCAICLEDFGPGDQRKVMACLHGFHAECLDKWLRSNGSCPVCKHRVAEG